MTEERVVMRLLVSVANAAEARAALAGGADVIDAKNPLAAGALGAVSPDVVREIHATVARRRLVTAAIGDAADETAIERAAVTFAGAGAALVKVGFAGITSASRVEALIAAAVRGVGAGGPIQLPSLWLRPGNPDPTDVAAGPCGPPSGGPIGLRPDPCGPIGLRPDLRGVVAVGYADADRVACLAAGVLIDVAVRAGATGVLLDTAEKAGPGLRELIAPAALARWVGAAHDAGLLVALAGKLTAEDLAFVRDAGADIAGVRGAACDGGRTGCVSTDRVALLRTLCNPPEGGSRVRDLADVRNVQL
jgi:uncharacterized protein (UPF0264 family)